MEALRMIPGCCLWTELDGREVFHAGVRSLTPVASLVKRIKQGLDLTSGPMEPRSTPRSLCPIEPMEALRMIPGCCLWTELDGREVFHAGVRSLSTKFSSSRLACQKN
jgi:hypothetical protein